MTNELLYLDPHTVQPAMRHHPRGAAAAAAQVRSCHHAADVPTMPMLNIDPSLALGFLCPTAPSFDDLLERCEALFEGALPLFSVATTLPDCMREDAAGWDDDDDEGEEGGRSDHGPDLA